MQNILKNVSSTDRSATPWILLLMLAGYVILGLFVFQILGFVILMPFHEMDFIKVTNMLSNPLGNPDAKLPLLIIQGITSAGAFIAIPIFFLWFNLKLKSREFFELPKPRYTPVLMTFMITLSFMVVNSVMIEWNQGIQLPESLRWFEEFAMGKEKFYEELTLYLTKFDHFGEFALGILIIAIIPAIGEELLFRGLLQNLLHSLFKNPHVGIWASALLFGAIHMQFYGMVPRILLGALFGYLYYWSGSLGLAMVGHFINNAFTVLMFYLNQIGYISFDPAEMEASPPLYIILIFFAISGFLLYLFRNYFDRKANAN